MATILFYSPFDQRSRDTESLMIAFRHQGHVVFSLSQQEGIPFNDFLEANDISAFSHVLPGKQHGWWFYVRHLFFFIRFCRTHRIDVVYSHLEPANFVSSIGQYFIKARTYLCRHHIDEGFLYKFDRHLYYHITYRLARKIVVVSNHAKRYMVEKERIPEKKIIHINLAYDFNLYKRAEEHRVCQIREQFKSEILLVAACRLTKFKRPELAVHVTKKLSDAGLHVKLVLLGRGELFDELHLLVNQLGLTDKVFMPGYVNNVLEFMKAADFFLHPSLLDSSCVAIKEAGLVNLPVIVCEGVGDFEDYLVDRENGFLTHPDRFVEEAAEIIEQEFRNKSFLKSIGKNLEKSVRSLFSIENVIERYDSLNVTKQ